jgi:hypothetical protein
MYQSFPTGGSIATTVDAIGAGGTANTISAFTGAVYATDSAAILGDFHQIGARLLLIEAALKARNIAVT